MDPLYKPREATPLLTPTMVALRSNNSLPHDLKGSHLPFYPQMKGNCNITVQQSMKRLLLCHVYRLTLRQLWVKMPGGSSARRRERPPVSGPAHLWCRMTPGGFGTPLHFDLHTTHKWTNMGPLIIICKLITCRTVIFKVRIVVYTNGTVWIRCFQCRMNLLQHKH